MQAVSLGDGRMRVGEQCKGCGRCAAACPARAITMCVDEGADVLGNLFARIERRTEIW